MFVLGVMFDMLIVFVMLYDGDYFVVFDMYW